MEIGKMASADVQITHQKMSHGFSFSVDILIFF